MEQCAPLVSLLENQKSPQEEPESDTKGVSAMGKMYKQRVKVGVQEDMTPIYKWACGHSIDEMNDCIVHQHRRDE